MAAKHPPGLVCLPAQVVAADVTSADAVTPDSAHSEQQPCIYTIKASLFIVVDIQYDAVFAISELEVNICSVQCVTAVLLGKL